MGHPLSTAIFAPPNCCHRIALSEGEMAELPNVMVRSAPPLDGVAPHMLAAPAESSFRLTAAAAVTRREAVDILSAAKTDVLINYLPVGSQAASAWWAEACLEAGCALCNCIPVFIASDPAWEARFVDAGLPLIGDDMRSQFGASVLSAMLGASKQQPPFAQQRALFYLSPFPSTATPPLFRGAGACARLRRPRAHPAELGRQHGLSQYAR